jgi:hypothetical protein
VHRSLTRLVQRARLTEESKANGIPLRADGGWRLYARRHAFYNETGFAEWNDQLAKIFLNALANFGAALKRFQIAPNVSYHARRERRICARVELEDTYEVGFSPWRKD